MKLNSPWIVSIKETFARIAGETHVEIPKGISWGFSANFQRQSHEKKNFKNIYRRIPSKIFEDIHKVYKHRRNFWENPWKKFQD